MKIAIITFGLPGSGKSTYLSNSFIFNDFFNCISADEIKKELEGYTDENYTAFYKQAVRIAEERVYAQIYTSTPFVFDTGSINSNYSKRILSKLKEAGYIINLLVFNTPVEVCIERDKNRPQSVGEEVIRAKYEKAPASLFNIVQLLDNNDVMRIVS